MLLMTYEIARAAAKDAGDKSMRKAGRTSWNCDDFFTSVELFNKLWPLGSPMPSPFTTTEEPTND